jgi:hypothetical protein
MRHSYSLSSAPAESSEANAVGQGGGSDVEDIYVVRSVRQTQETATPFCEAAKVGFENTNNDADFLFRSTSEPNVANFYGEGRLFHSRAGVIVERCPTIPSAD